MNNITIQLAKYKTIDKYIPKLGDFIIKHGWFSHKYGIITGTHEDELSAVFSPMPILLFTSEFKKLSSQKLVLSKINKSRGGYAILQNDIWYV